MYIYIYVDIHEYESWIQYGYEVILKTDANDHHNDFSSSRIMSKHEKGGAKKKDEDRFRQ